MPHRKQLKENILFLMLAIATLLILGTVIFSILEGWSAIDSFYFVAMTATTVGYGDLVPTHTLSKLITVAYSLMIIPVFLYTFTAIAKFEVERVNRQIHGIERKQREQDEDIDKAERRIQSQKHQIKDQEEILEKQSQQLKKQVKITKEQQEELEGHQREIKKQEKELEVVEDIVEEVLEEEVLGERGKIKKGLKERRGKHY